MESRWWGFLLISCVFAVLNVHIVCHTHDDVGWLKTVDEYYMGANNSIQHAGVQYILDSVIDALQKNPDRTFVYVEQAFFQRWWRQQDTTTQAAVKKLVENQQLEFINGGWCMHDEAAPHYISMIDQTTLGHKFIKEQFGVVPKIGWQIDPFGHSATQAALLSAEVGFDALFFGRIDYQDHDIRMKESNMEFIWKASPSLPDAKIFSGAFQSGNYGPPEGFCYDMFCDDPPIQDDERLDDVNIKNRVDLFVNRTLEAASHTLGNEIMFTMGSDFQFENAHVWFKNLEKLLYYLKKDGRVNAFYSTPSKYIAAKFKEGLTFRQKEDDFFPYADCPNCFWTGYFVSRPALKRHVRHVEAFYQASKQLEVFGGGDGQGNAVLAEAVGVAQHHDAVSGTSKQHVAFDYAKRLSRGVLHSWATVSATLNKWLSKSQGAPLTILPCELRNESICSATESLGNGVAVLIYNSLAKARQEVVWIPVSTDKVQILDYKGNSVVSQVVANTINQRPRVSSRSQPFSVVFSANLAPLGYTTYFVAPSGAADGDAAEVPAPVTVKRVDADTVISNEFYSLSFSSAGYWDHITNKAQGVSSAIEQNFFWYNSSNIPRSQPSGAYIFRPNGTKAWNVSAAGPALTLTQGRVFSQIEQRWTPWLTQFVRLYAGQNNIEVEYDIGPIPFADGLGKEVITRFLTDLDSQTLIYTDSNGREMQERKLNYRPTWTLNVTEPVAGNYYPVNTNTFIRDKAKLLSIVTDRTQGAASLASGQVEVMLHRRTLADDWRGVGEALNETEYIAPYPDPIRQGEGLRIRAKHYITLTDPSSGAATFRPLAARVFAEPLVGFVPLTGTVKDFVNAYNLQAAQGNSLPENLDLITLEALPQGRTLLRVAHEFAVGEDAELSKPANLDLNAIFPAYTVSNVVEMSLTNNVEKAKMQRLNWRVKGDSNSSTSVTQLKGSNSPIVTVNPLEIKTYQVTLVSK